jgi:hypothetical protein
MRTLRVTGIYSDSERLGPACHWQRCQCPLTRSEASGDLPRLRRAPSRAAPGASGLRGPAVPRQGPCCQCQWPGLPLRVASGWPSSLTRSSSSISFVREQFTDQEQVRPGLARAVTGQAASCRGQMPRRVPLRFHVAFVVPYDRDSQKLPATEDWGSPEMVTRKMLPSSDTNRTSLRTSRGRFVLPARSFVQACWRVGEDAARIKSLGFQGIFRSALHTCADACPRSIRY